MLVVWLLPFPWRRDLVAHWPGKLFHYCSKLIDASLRNYVSKSLQEEKDIGFSVCLAFDVCSACRKAVALLWFDTAGRPLFACSMIGGGGSTSPFSIGGVISIFHRVMPKFDQGGDAEPTVSLHCFLLQFVVQQKGKTHNRSFTPCCLNWAEQQFWVPMLLLWLLQTSHPTSQNTTPLSTSHSSLFPHHTGAKTPSTKELESWWSHDRIVAVQLQCWWAPLLVSFLVCFFFREGERLSWWTKKTWQLWAAF